MAIRRSRASDTFADDPAPAADPPVTLPAPAPPAPMPLIGVACDPFSAGWLMGIGRVDNIKPPNPPGLAGHYVGICNHGSESEAEHATRLGASAGTATDIGWLLGTIKDAVCTAGGGGGTTQICEVETVSVLAAPTGAVNGIYEHVPFTGGAGSSSPDYKFTGVPVTGGVIDASALLAEYPVDFTGVYAVGDVLTVAAGKVGAGSSSWTVRVETVYCYPPGGGGGGGTSAPPEANQG